MTTSKEHSPKEVAATEAVDTKTVYEWVDRDLIEHRRTPTGRLRLAVDGAGHPIQKKAQAA